MFRTFRVAKLKAFCAKPSQFAARPRPAALLKASPFHKKWNRGKPQEEPKINKNGIDPFFSFLMGITLGGMITIITEIVGDEDPEKDLHDALEELNEALKEHNLKKLKRSVHTLEPNTNAVCRRSLLHTCVKMDWYPAVEFLLDKNISCSNVDPVKYTPILIYAMRVLENEDIIELICQKRPDLIHQTNLQGRTALQIADENQWGRFATILEKYGAK